jgi:DNA primase
MILDLVQKHTALKKASSREWAGPCPLCGGTDRFRVWPEKGEGGQWWCRRCNQGGDVLAFLRKVEGMSCPEAHIALGLECTSISCEVRDRCRLGEGRPSRTRTPWPRLDTPKPITEKSRIFTPDAAADPGDAWQSKALALVSWAHEQLLNTPKQLDGLYRRGLPPEAVQRFGLGWIPEDLYRSRKKWGLPEEVSDRTGQLKRLWLPRGIVIPCFIRPGVHRVRIRRPEGEPRYYCLPGSGNDSLILTPEARAHLIVESDLDAYAVAHAAGGLAAVVSLGSSSAKPKKHAWKVLSSSPCVLIALDNDAAGAKGAEWWVDALPNAHRWPVPKGKDPGDYCRDHGGDLRAWVLAGLQKHCPALALVEKRPAPDLSGDPAGALRH